MKTLLRSLLFVLTFATTGLFAQATTDAPAPTPQGQHQSVKKGKKGKVHKKRHKRHQKKSK